MNHSLKNFSLSDDETQSRRTLRLWNNPGLCYNLIQKKSLLHRVYLLRFALIPYAPCVICRVASKFVISSKGYYSILIMFLSLFKLFIVVSFFGQKMMHALVL